jgi:hypothetical protein
LAAGLVKNIQAGCDLYKQAKESFVEIKRTGEEVVAIGKELHGFWNQLLAFFGSKPKPKAANPVGKAKKSDYVAVDETQVKADIVKNLSEFFKLQEQLETHIRESEERARTVVFADDVNLMEEALNRVLAQQEMERLVVQIRECMVYQSPPEMGALYSEVFAMKDVIAAEQQKARKKRDEDQWQRKERERLLAEKQVYLLVSILFLLYMWLLIGVLSKTGRA